MGICHLQVLLNATTLRCSLCISTVFNSSLQLARCVAPWDIYSRISPPPAGSKQGDDHSFISLLLLRPSYFFRSLNVSSQGMQRTRDDLEKKLHDSNTTPMFFPLEFLKAITCDFSTESVLGEGGFGVVYKGVLRSGKVIAVKKLFEIRLKEDTFQNEVRYLMGIKHQNIVQFLGYCAESSWEAIEQPSGSGKFIFGELPKRLLCFEYVCNISLDNHISDESSGLEWNMRYEIIKGICNGLHFLHEECHMVHLDLKPENILMDSTMIPKIADFGLSRIFGEQQTRIVTDNRAGTCGYMAPEYLIRGVVSNKADIFSLGVILIEIITGDRDYPYFHHDSSQRDATTFQQFTEKVLENWRNRFTSTPKYTKEKYAHQVKQCVTIALKCVDPSMEKRPTAKHIIQVFNVADQMETHEELPSVVQCVDKLLALNTTGSKNLTPMSATEEMLIIKAATGKQVDEAKSEGLLPMPTIEPSTIRQNYQEGVKACNERQSATDTESEVSTYDTNFLLCKPYMNKVFLLKVLYCAI
ncbi:receptor-like serine/threonine-protein kinase SD1-6 isoform X1 [Triticum aestivum]|nr:receptor-like serine/threonine-protein kinase SD1-6 isoform X1 [Triticum aestivum]